MPLYETVMQEKPPVVMDIGTAYTKLGFAAEPYPRKIIPSEVILTKNGQTKNLFDYKNGSDFYDQVVDFLQMLFFKYLLVSPKERKIVIVENIFGETIVRETLARALFRHFEVSSVLFAPSHSLSLASLAVHSALVVDIGYRETTVVPVFSGVQIIQAFQDQPYGGRMLHAEIRKQLGDLGVSVKNLRESILEDIKVRTCFVTTMERSNAYREDKLQMALPPVEYPIDGDTLISIPGKLRETAFEFMFANTNERNSLPHMILQSLLRCPRDVRRCLIENIFLIGGSVVVMGLLPRLKAELWHLVKTDAEYKNRLPSGIEFKFHKAIGCPNFAAWLGGSLCGSTDLITTRSLSKETYVRTSRVPDWICLNDNHQ